MASRQPATKQKRNPRFKRARTTGFRITDRDVTIIRHVYEHRLLDSNHIVALLGDGSPQQIRRRLQLLYHGRYLDRPRVQLVDFYRQPGSAPMVYALGNKGADLLAREGSVERYGVDWTAKNRAVKSRFFHHTLMVASIMVGFELACRAHGRVRIIPFHEILETICPPETRERKRPKTWYVSLPRHGRFGVTPDTIFGLHYLDRPDGKNRAYFFLEADRGSMPIIRRGMKATSIYEKLVLYHASYKQRHHTRQFGFKQFRVLTVTSGPKRVKSMLSVASELDGLQGLFLFRGMAGVEGGEVLRGWVNGRGERVELS